MSEQAIDGVRLRRFQSGGADTVIAAVTTAALVPFVQQLLSRSADSIYDWVRHHVRSGREVRVVCSQARLTLVVDDLPEAAVGKLADLDLDALPKPCLCRWDAERDEWSVRPQ